MLDIASAGHRLILPTVIVGATHANAGRSRKLCRTRIFCGRSYKTSPSFPARRFRRQLPSPDRVPHFSRTLREAGILTRRPYRSYPASACRMLRITVCAKLSATATSPSSKLKGSGANTISNPTVSRSKRTGAARIERTPSRRQLSRSTRGSTSASSHLKALPSRKHSPESPEFTSSRVPSAGALSPTLARHITPSL